VGLIAVMTGAIAAAIRTVIRVTPKTRIFRKWTGSWY